MKISVTERHFFKNCRRQWYYQFVEGLQSHVEPVPLWFGRAIHSAMDAYYKDEERRWSTLTEAYAKFVKENPRQGTYFEEAAALGPNVLETYWCYDRYQPRWEIVSIEDRIEVPILDPYTRVPLESGTLVGRLDLQIKDNGGVAIVDHKTARQVQSLGGLEVDDQMTAYAYLYWRTTGNLPTKIIYNTISKSERKYPEVLKGGGVSKNKNQATTAERYRFLLERLKLDEKDYSDVIAELGKRPAIMRYETTRNLREMFSFEKALYDEYIEMVRLSKDFGAAYTNASTWNCSFCRYLPLCKAQNEGGNIQFIRSMGYKKGNQNDDDGYNGDIVTPA